MEILRIENLNFQYVNEEKLVLNDINMSIEEGDFLVLCGATGSGKTTLLKMLKREIAPNGNKRGTIFYQGKDLKEYNDKELVSEIGYVFQNPDSAIVTDKVWHELAFGLENLGYDNQNIRMKVGEIANYFDMQTWFDMDTNSLSGGQKQILNLASVMVMQPKVLLLDEPTSQMDPVSASNFFQTLKKINHELGTTIIIIEHRLEEIFLLADKIALLDDGKLVVYDEVKKASKEILNYSNININIPTPLKLYHELECEDEVPLTIKDGKKLLGKYNFSENSQYDKPLLREKNKAIEIKNGWFRYSKNSKDILKGIDLDIRIGEVYSLIGGNGVGKSTLVNVIANNLKLYTGNVKINEKSISKYKNNSLYIENLVVLPQNPDDLFVSEMVSHELYEMKNIYSDNFENRVKEIIDDFDLEELLSRHPYDLSGGEKQKVALAKILLLNPKIILFDEPTKGLDWTSKIKLVEIIKRLKKKNVTCFLVTHDIEFASLVSDYCGLLFNGTIVSENSSNLFFKNNHFYTTATNKLMREINDNIVVYDDMIKWIKENGYEKDN